MRTIQMATFTSIVYKFTSILLTYIVSRYSDFFPSLVLLGSYQRIDLRCCPVQVCNNAQPDAESALISCIRSLVQLNQRHNSLKVGQQTFQTIIEYHKIATKYSCGQRAGTKNVIPQNLSYYFLLAICQDYQWKFWLLSTTISWIKPAVILKNNWQCSKIQ